MTPDEQTRLVKLEVMFEAHRNDMAEIRKDLDGIKKALDEIVAAANMGRGAWWLLLKIGGIAIAGIGGVAWIMHEMNRIGMRD